MQRDEAETPSAAAATPPDSVPPDSVPPDSAPPQAAPGRSRARAFVRQGDLCYVGFAAIMLPAWIYAVVTTGTGSSYVVRNAGVLLLFTALRWGRREPAPLRTATWLRIGIACIVLPFNYFQTGPLIELTRAEAWLHYEDLLAGWDTELLGAGYHQWLIDARVPWITEVLQLCYAAFYVLPLGLLVLLMVRGKSWTLPRALFGVVSCFLISYVGYLFVPGRSPAFLHPELVHSGGVWIATDVWHHVREAGKGAYDVFPSGHTAVCLLVIYYAWVLDRLAFYILTPIATCVILSTIYLQYHYIVDLPAGLLLTLLVILWDGVIRWRTDAEPSLETAWRENLP